ncbi:MAG: hypothetical protein KAU06_04700 [Candidatus Marinimicrobia bacterium]|nr:hypothetical protein [Candidatus Neomarinimicrobiota bacterium]
MNSIQHRKPGLLLLPELPLFPQLSHIHNNFPSHPKQGIRNAQSHNSSDRMSMVFAYNNIRTLRILVNPGQYLLIQILID